MPRDPKDVSWARLPRSAVPQESRDYPGNVLGRAPRGWAAADHTGWTGRLWFSFPRMPPHRCHLGWEVTLGSGRPLPGWMAAGMGARGEGSSWPGLLWLPQDRCIGSPWPQLPGHLALEKMMQPELGT